MATGAVVVAGGTPEVNGTPVALLAPENAGPWVEAVGFGVAVLFRGFRTLERSMLATWRSRDVESVISSEPSSTHDKMSDTHLSIT